MSCYADAQTLWDIRRMFAYVFDPATPRGGGLPQLELFAILGPFCVGRQEVVPVPILHGQRPILGFRIGGFAYLTDCSRIPDESWELLRGLDLLVLDALREKPHPTHFSISEAVDAARQIGAGRTCFTHMTHDLRHETTCARLPDTMQLAYDGQVIEI
jgi:phosphoribosyl 1,2-cyclic phosphate phosphodiesterase